MLLQGVAGQHCQLEYIVGISPFALYRQLCNSLEMKTNLEMFAVVRFL
jgi:hypothetical protein